MSEPEQFSKPLPVSNDVVVKLPEDAHIYTSSKDIVKANGSTFYNSSKELVDKIATLFREYCRPNELYEQGIKAEILEPGKKWVKGKIRLRLVIEFLPDEPEDNKATGEFVSSLDDIRNINL